MNDYWKKIKAHEEEGFHTVTNKPFVYKVIGDAVVTDSGKWKIPKSQFEKAIEYHPSMVKDINNKVIGPSYVFAILKDSRINAI